MIKHFFTVLLLWSIQAHATPKWFDQSHEIFLTPELGHLASNYRDFPLFWWNFLILDGDVKWEDAEALCADIATSQSEFVQKLPCHFELKNLKAMTEDWLRDLPLRQPIDRNSTRLNS